MMHPDTQDMAPGAVSFESAHLIYRGVEKEDVDFFFKNGQDTAAMSALNPNIQLPNSKKKTEDTMTYLGEHALIAAIICLRPEAPTASATAADGASATAEPVPIPIGHIMLSKSTPTMAHHRNCTLGIGMLNEYRGKGYGSEAIMWMLNWGFRVANMHRIGLECFGWNVGAAKLYQKLGFKLEGSQRESLWFNGRWWDNMEFSMLENEWRDLQKKGV